MPIAKCEECGKEVQIWQARVGTFRFCSRACHGAWNSTHRAGENHPRWLGGEREKICEGCGVKMIHAAPQPITSFKKQKFCSKPCADKHGYRREGADHPLYRVDSRRNNRRGKHGAWARACVSRDNATCQHCGATEVELHVHHIKSFLDFPELRWDLSNGITLCNKCHWAVHSTALTANGVNSGKAAAGNAAGNPEPSFGRKPIEGVTTRGRAYRRWNGNCAWCGIFISKRWSDTTGKAFLCCGGSCASKERMRRQKANAHGSNASTSAPPERDDIV